MSWDNEKRLKHFKDIERILKREIYFDTKEEIKARPLSNIKDLPPPDRSKCRKFTRVIPRDEWGTIPPSKLLHTPLVLPIHKIHYSYYRNWPPCYTREKFSQILRMLQLREMKERGLPDLRHNFLIGNDSNVYEGRGWNFRAELPYDCDPKEWDEQTLDIGFFAEEDDHGNQMTCIYVTGERLGFKDSPGDDAGKFLHWGMYESFLKLIGQGVAQTFITEDYKMWDLYTELDYEEEE